MDKIGIKAVKKNGYVFLFKYDKDAPELLHIYVRHLKHPIDAIERSTDAQNLSLD